MAATMRPHARSCASAMRHRRYGCSATGTNEAMWPQYSKSTLGRWFDAASSNSAGYGPRRLKIGMGNT